MQIMAHKKSSSAVRSFWDQLHFGSKLYRFTPCRENRGWFSTEFTGELKYFVAKQ